MTLIRLPDDPIDNAKPTLTPPIGLWSIRECIHGTRVVDLNVEDPDTITDDIVGYSLHFPSQERHLRAVREFVTAKTEILGGPHGGLMKVDGVESYYGPGETYFLGKDVGFADLPYPRFSEEEMLPYWSEAKPFGLSPKTERWMPVEFSRGCPNACRFCAMPSFWGKWQAKPLPVVASYLMWLSNRHEVREIIVLDDNISADRHYFMSMLGLFANHGITWSAPNGIYARTLLDPQVIVGLSRSHCHSISLPFETGCEASAEAMGIGKKRFTFGEAHMLVDWLKAEGIKTTGFFIIGYPGETEHDVKETLAFANALPLDARHIYFATPYRGTKLHEVCTVNNYIVHDERTATYKTPVISTPWLSRERLLELWKEDHDAALRRKA